ncbi:GNAT family N-acetyltransferase [Paenibacillus flagellatus]|uniref:N-acetyltransferase n=1 Tax=Paenibacillus flagellatus TaxID=2211139 RepID=A0A2V5KQF0_9BACL|nr:GNAT family N-acetyltransferase [Paenibacillus flagellatus]PYI50876.1 N-acetyltransferase [Paenibacillus flagellatus]
MIRKRNPRRDDRIILDLVKRELFPYTLRTMPNLRWDPSDVRRRLERNVTFVAVPGRGSAVGFASVRKVGKDVFLDMLAVDRNSQGKGLGAELLRESERYARSRGATTIRLYVDETNDRARLFYARHGYAEEGYYPVLRCFGMGKMLNTSGESPTGGYGRTGRAPIPRGERPPARSGRRGRRLL